MNEKVEVVIRGRRLDVVMEGLTPIEIAALAQKVSDRIDEMHRQHKSVVDTSKIALLAAMDLAAELDKERAAHDLTRRVLENKAETLSQSLRESLPSDAGAPPE